MVARSKPDAITSVEITWAIPSRPPAMPGEPTATLLGIGLRPSRPSIPQVGGRHARVLPVPPRVMEGSGPGLRVPDADFSTLVCLLGREMSLPNATRLVENEAKRLTGSALALCVFFDWTQRRAWTLQGHDPGEMFNEIIAEVAGSGRSATSRHVIIEPIGRVPTNEEQDRLFKNAEDNTKWEHVYCAAILAANTSMRGVEVKHARRRDFD